MVDKQGRKVRLKIEKLDILLCKLLEQDQYGHSQLRNIGVAPDLIIQYMYHLEGNKSAIGLDYRKIPGDNMKPLNGHVIWVKLFWQDR